MKEDEIQIQVAQFLRLYERSNKFLWWSVPNEGGAVGKNKFHAMKRMSHFKRMGLRPGVADLSIIHEGKYYAIELKTKTGRMSKFQENFKESCEICGCPYELCRSLDDVRVVMDKWGIIPIT